MKKFFYTPKHEYTGEKISYVRIFNTVMIMLTMIYTMCFTCYALFSAVVSSANNTLEAGIYSLDIKIDGTVLNNNTTILDNGTHTITISTNADTTTSEGFCIIKDITNNTTYYTEQIYADDGDLTPSSITFTLTVDAPTTIVFTPHWGVAAKYNYSSNCIENADEITIL